MVYILQLFTFIVGGLFETKPLAVGQEDEFACVYNYQRLPEFRAGPHVLILGQTIDLG